MKAITIHQPWASLIAIGAKQFETRGWRTNYRGPIAIHASKREPLAMLRQLPEIVQVSIFNCFYEKFGINDGAMKRMPTGCIVAVANLSEVWKWDDHDGVLLRKTPIVEYDDIGTVFNHKDISQTEKSFGWYDAGRFAWEMTDVKMLDDPIPAKGQQGLWNFDIEGTEVTHEQ